mgnify:CR=1 FL=1
MSLPDFGTSILEAMQHIVAARRTPLPTLSLWQHATAMFNKKELPQLIGQSLTTLKLQGYTPEDFVEHAIPWDKMVYSTDSLIDFGFKWHHMIALNFQPHHFQKLDWCHYLQLKIDANAMMQTCLSVHDLVALKLTPQQLHQMGWTWDHLTAIGANENNLNISKQDLNIYFGHTAKNSRKTIGKTIGKTDKPSISKFKF